MSLGSALKRFYSRPGRVLPYLNRVSYVKTYSLDFFFFFIFSVTAQIVKFIPTRVIIKKEQLFLTDLS